MEMLEVITVLAGIAFLLTKSICRRPLRDGRPPSFSLTIIAACFAALAMVFIIYGLDLFTPKFWDSKGNPGSLVPMVFLICMGISLVPASLVVWHQRKKFREMKRAT